MVRLLSALPVFLAAALITSAASSQSAFDGFYVGGQGWYSNYDLELSVSGVGSASDNLEGFGGGGFVGWGFTNKAMAMEGFALYGAIEGEIGYDGADNSESIAGVRATVEANETYGIGVRAGVITDDRWLFYGRLGWQRTNGEASVSGFGSDSEDIDGFRMGGGVEVIVTGPFSVRGEYTYTIYEDPSDIPGVSLDIDQHLFRIGAAYRF